jgi:hypothetical protein
MNFLRNANAQDAQEHEGIVGYHVDYYATNILSVLFPIRIQCETSVYVIRISLRPLLKKNKHFSSKKIQISLLIGRYDSPDL